MVMSPQVSWLFFKAVRAGLAVKRPYLSHTGRASNAEKQPTGRGPEGCVENGPAARGNVSVCRRVGVCKASSTLSRPPDHYSRVEKQSYFPRRRYANTPTRRHAPQSAAHFERNDVTIICETVHEIDNVLTIIRTLLHTIAQTVKKISDVS